MSIINLIFAPDCYFKRYVIMKKKIIVSCEKWTGNASSPRIVLFKRDLDTDGAILIPYEELERSLRFLFGDDTIVTFSLDNYFSIH